VPLIQCPDCGKEVSDAAPACPNCGRPISVPSQDSEPQGGSIHGKGEGVFLKGCNWGCFLLIAFMVVVFLIVAIGG